MPSARTRAKRGAGVGPPSTRASPGRRGLLPTRCMPRRASGSSASICVTSPSPSTSSVIVFWSRSTFARPAVALARTPDRRVGARRRSPRRGDGHVPPLVAGPSSRSIALLVRRAARQGEAGRTRPSGGSSCDGVARGDRRAVAGVLVLAHLPRRSDEPRTTRTPGVRHRVDVFLRGLRIRAEVPLSGPERRGREREQRRARVRTRATARVSIAVGLYAR